ncbi:MAG: nucleotide pyrophosphohydrolase [Alteromonadaceae bacterium]|nr:nucleotide pyrophosphohydrolase [Alteromonadaceae bacterium]
MELNELVEKMDFFVRKKGWYNTGSTKPQKPENIAKSICIESAELLECFQWIETPDKFSVESEAADIILYVAQLANLMNIDLNKAVLTKLKINETRDWE